MIIPGRLWHSVRFCRRPSLQLVCDIVWLAQTDQVEFLNNAQAAHFVALAKLGTKLFHAHHHALHDLRQANIQDAQKILKVSSSFCYLLWLQDRRQAFWALLKFEHCWRQTLKHSSWKPRWQTQVRLFLLVLYYIHYQHRCFDTMLLEWFYWEDK